VLKILSRGVRLKLEIKLELLLFATLLMSLDTDLAFARHEAAQEGSATSANEVAGHGNAEQAVGPRRSLQRRNTACLYPVSKN
jgi:hypothetical protein